MERTIFVNLPVEDLATSRRFYTGLGFGINEAYTDETALAVVVSDTIVALLMTRDRFAGFVTAPVADPRTSIQVINALSAESREEVDDLTSRALANGGTEYRETYDDGGMYGRAFTDPDGHVWELVHMDMVPESVSGDAEGETPAG